MFTRIKEAMSNTLRAMGQFVTTGAQTVAGVIKGPVNGLIAFCNWVVDGLNSLSFSLFGKKFGIDLDKIPMLAEGGVAVPGASRRAGRVLPLTNLERQQTLARRTRSRSRSQLPHNIKEFHERWAPAPGAPPKTSSSSRRHTHEHNATHEHPRGPEPESDESSEVTARWPT